MLVNLYAKLITDHVDPYVPLENTYSDWCLRESSSNVQGSGILKRNGRDIWGIDCRD